MGERQKRYRWFHWFIACTVLLAVLGILRVDAFSKGCSEQNIKPSSHRFITQYYKDLLEGKIDEVTIKRYYLESLDKEDQDVFDRMDAIIALDFNKEYPDIYKENLGILVRFGNVYKDVLKFKFEGEIETFSKKPLIIEIAVYEWVTSSTSIDFPVSLFRLKDVGECEWRIIDIGAPGLP